MENKIKSIRKFCDDHIILIITISLFTAFCYIFSAITTNIGIDTEQYILEQYGKDWVLQGLGRFGCYYTTMFLNMKHYNPYANAFFCIAILILAVLLWIYNFYKIGGNGKKYYYVLFAIILVSNPLWATQFYFKLQQGAISVGLFLQAVSFELFFDVLLDYRKNERIINICEVVISIGCAFWALGTYQAFVNLHLVEAAACLMLLFERMLDEEKNEKKVHSLFWKRVLFVVIHFFLSFGLYEGICKVRGWGTSNYLQLKWGILPIQEIIYSLNHDFMKLLLGQEEYAGWIVAVSIGGALVLLTKKFLEKIHIYLKLDYLLLIIGNIVGMFALNIVIGEVPAERARLAVTFTTAFLGMYIFSRCIDVFEKNVKKVVAVSMGIIISISIISQVDKLETLFYTDDICNKQQFVVGGDIVKEIEELGGNADATVIIVGKWEAPLNKACLKIAPVGNSSFDWDYYEGDPISGTRRSVLYLNATFGKEYNFSIEENDRNSVIMKAINMPSYPQKGYVQCDNGKYIVKLSSI